MARILVAGGTGSLGKAIVAALQSTAHHVRIMSHRTAPAQLDAHLEWATADVTTGAGLAAALDGVDVIVNCLGNYQRVYEVDVLGVQRLAEMAQDASVNHFFHISIAGIDRVEGYDFYGHKLAAEQLIIGSGVPYSIQRVTQFHAFIFQLLAGALEPTPDGYLLPTAADAVFQPIATSDIAAYTLRAILDAPAGHLPDVGGPEILRVDEMARAYLAARGVDSPALIRPLQDFFPEPAVAAFRQGLHTVPHHRYGQITWADHVRSRVAGSGESLV